MTIKFADFIVVVGQILTWISKQMCTLLCHHMKTELKTNIIFRSYYQHDWANRDSNKCQREIAIVENDSIVVPSITKI